MTRSKAREKNRLRKLEKSLERKGSESSLLNTGEGNEKKESLGPQSVDTWASTEDYSEFDDENLVKSPVFEGGPKTMHQWRLKIHPICKWWEAKFVCLSLVDFGDENDSDESRVVKTCFQISFLDANDQPRIQRGYDIMSKDRCFCEFKKGDNVNFKMSIHNENPTALELNNDDTLKIHCSMLIQVDIKERTGNGVYSGKENRIVKQREQLQKDLGELLLSSDFADFSFTTLTQTFRAHKNILASRSTFFSTMFANKMQESVQNCIDFSHLDAKGVEGMLEYIYTGQVKSLPENAQDLLMIANLYNLPGLKEECQLSMANNLSVDTAAEVLVLANLYTLPVLKPIVVNFIVQNKKQVRKSKTFQKVAAANPADFLDLFFSQ